MALSSWIFCFSSVKLSGKEIISIQLNNFKIIRMEVWIVLKKSKLGINLPFVVHELATNFSLALHDKDGIKLCPLKQVKHREFT